MLGNKNYNHVVCILLGYVYTRMLTAEALKLHNYSADCTDHELCTLSQADAEAIQTIIDKYHYELELKGFNFKEHIEL